MYIKSALADFLIYLKEAKYDWKVDNSCGFILYLLFNGVDLGINHFAFITASKTYNRGFLNGPWIPIYGFGAMLVIVLFDIQQVNYPIYTLFISGGVVACLLEYITSYVMEKLFHRRWWDYSQKAFNLNGRVCLEGFICFGLFSVVAIDYCSAFLLVSYY